MAEIGLKPQAVCSRVQPLCHYNRPPLLLLHVVCLQKESNRHAKESRISLIGRIRKGFMGKVAFGWSIENFHRWRTVVGEERILNCKNIMGKEPGEENY